ncbi:MAG: thermonuclease family protein [Mesorhizobium sp.]|uniref:thermonuclease family protein n=2 Tax=Mesorhizobium TaxID=68287 RepID=UPI000FD223BB|nr:MULTISPECIES: thermonuclease family protein [unclassified Mesorhizobium]MCT2581290.1 thermonuclease family protein [Mesorhizobium sp. P13.3]MDF3170315.1 thermonuclease family protein [Mesorhizobium sp. P16.1]MDF3181230.1 thermonuclease family protein [Mesorhizobium sp. P17.1]MDF3187203.1 thermonuclease family protein [Mesorhizobium sp. ICCV3110.1]RUV67472.1 thermonuclease family protein [Mesorhizobium sp. M1A.F.Ca.IN.020.30.1.1]
MRRFLVVLTAALPVAAHAAPAGYFDLQPGVTLETGDTWVTDRQRFRLYGVQSCLRGTSYTDNKGQKRDCGDASLAIFAAYIKDTKPVCAPVAKAAGISYVVCYATVGKDRLDLATMMITSGYAFAALSAEGLPFHPAYAVAEQDAREKRAGLWQFEDVQHPAILLSREASDRAKKAKQ